MLGRIQLSFTFNITIFNVFKITNSLQMSAAHLEDFAAKAEKKHRESVEESVVTMQRLKNLLLAVSAASLADVPKTSVSGEEKS